MTFETMEPLSISAFVPSTLFLLTLVALLLYFYLKYVVYNLWNREGVPHEKPLIPLGNVPLSYFKGEITHGKIIKETYEKFKKSRFYGLYILYEPVLVINDPELIRHVLVKNFTQFYNRGRLMDIHKDVLSTTLTNLSDGKWKRIRSKLSPAFSSGKLKLMYLLIDDICHKLIKAVDKELAESNVLETKEFTIRYGLDCISSIAYGSEVDCLNNPGTNFYKYGKASGYTGRYYLLSSLFIPELMKFLPVPGKRRVNEKYFVDLFTEMVEYRRKENISRNDILNMVMQLIDYGQIDDENSTQNMKTSNGEPDKFTMLEGVGQSFTFFSADLDTTSMLIPCCLFELAMNPDVQEQLFDELYEVYLSTDGLSYEKIFQLPYLDMVFKETLRKYPATPFLGRICTEDFRVPDSEYVIKKGMRIAIPTMGLHTDPDIYPEPEKFDPTRFTPENQQKRHNFTYLPFGDGPRQCIGKRLATLKSKMALFYLLLNYKFSPCDKTPPTLTLLPDHFIQVPCNIPLKMEKRNLKENESN